MRGPSTTQVSTALVVREGQGGAPYWEAKWRSAGRQFKRRLGPAWLDRDGAGGWRKRLGRCPNESLDERKAHVRAAEVVAEVERELAELERGRLAARARLVTVRGVAHEWLRWLEEVKGAKPSTLRDYEALLREPGAAFKRGQGTSAGRIMGALGDRPARDVTSTHVSRFLRTLDGEGLTPRNVNKHRQVLAAIFTFACREDTFGLPANPVDATDKRREQPPVALDYYEVEEVEALARACEQGKHRSSNTRDEGELEARRSENCQDAEALRLLFYSGVRLGEALTLRWADVDLPDRTLLIHRNLSAGVETLPKGRRHRFVPLPMPAVEALARLAQRRDFTAPDDYVLCNRLGRRLDPSAFRRRYKLGCQAAELRPVKLHGLRHAAGSLVARTTDAVFTRDFLGHSKLTTTDRYVSAKLRPEEYERLDRAFTSGPTDGTELGTGRPRAGHSRSSR
jgi:integrase